MIGLNCGAHQIVEANTDQACLTTLEVSAIGVMGWRLKPW